MTLNTAYVLLTHLLILKLSLPSTVTCSAVSVSSHTFPLKTVGKRNRLTTSARISPKISTFRCHMKTLLRRPMLLFLPILYQWPVWTGWLGSRMVSVLDSGAEGPGFKSQSRCCRVTVLGKLYTPILPLFTKQQNW